VSPAIRHSSQPDEVATSWNPLRVAGTSLPANLLLMAKIIVLVFVLSGGLLSLPRPFLPFIPGLDQILPADEARIGFQFLAAAFAVALVFNRFVRTSSFIVGAVILIAILSSRTYYENNRLFAGLILLMTGLYHPSVGGSLVRVQVVLMYFGAALNKLLEADWRSGQFFASWAAVSPYQHVYNSIAHLAPGATFYVVMGWSVIVVEFAIAGGLAVPRLRPLAIGLGVAYHSSLLIVAGRTFGLFWFALLASYLAFVDWPVKATVRTATQGVWQQLAALLRRVDLERGVAWVSGPVTSLEWTTESGRTRSGLTALVFVTLVNPITYIVAACVLAPLPEHRVRIAGIIAMAALAVIAIDGAFTHGPVRIRELRRWRDPSRRLGVVPGSRSSEPESAIRV
jgi:hypothetical protein